jgi:hypothetical protein
MLGQVTSGYVYLGKVRKNTSGLDSLSLVRLG